MELWDLYPIDRAPVGQTIARGETAPEGLRHLVVNIWLFNSKDELLIQRRQPFKTGWSGMWDATTGGSAVAGETGAEAAARELFEEMGIRHDFTGAYPALTLTLRTLFLDYYIVRRDLPLSDLRLQPDEVAEARWASREEIFRMIDEGIFIPYSRPFVDLMFHLLSHPNHRTRPDDTHPVPRDAR